MVDVPGIDGLGKVDRIAGAFDVHSHLGFFVGPQVVHRSKVKKMVDLPLELFHVLRGDSELLGREVAKHRHGSRGRHAPVAAQVGHLVCTLLADQEMHHRPFALQQLLDQSLANEPRCPRHEILHG